MLTVTTETKLSHKINSILENKIHFFESVKKVRGFTVTELQPYICNKITLLMFMIIKMLKHKLFSLREKCVEYICKLLVNPN